MLQLYCGGVLYTVRKACVLYAPDLTPVALPSELMGGRALITVHLSRILADKGGKDSRIKNKSVAFNVPFSHFV